MTDIFAAPRFRDDNEARKALEAILWPDGPICPHCGVINHAYATKRPGVYPLCRKRMPQGFHCHHADRHGAQQDRPAQVATGVPLDVFQQEGRSAHQLHRTLDITYEAAWFMAHRIREAMRAGGLAPLGGGGNIVEADETYYGQLTARYFEPTKKADWSQFNKEGRTAQEQASYRRAGRARRQCPHFPCSGRRQRYTLPRLCERTSRASHACTLTKAASISGSR